jgi:hypothetical protein
MATMELKTFALVAAMLLSATAVSLAQSLPNYGPNAPAHGDTFGKAPSGSYPPRSGYRAYAYRQHWHHHYHRHWHHRYWYY